MKTAEQIRIALQNKEFHLEYMPTMDLSNNRCVGAEALIRWHANGEFISPDEFIPLIENTPLSGMLTYWIIEEVARDLGAWLREFEGVHVGINVPPELIGRGGVEYAATNSGLIEVIDKLILEVTERGFPDQLALDALNQNNGRVKVAIDDFGTGDANMMQMSKMKADIIKLDKYFVDQINEKDHAPKIVKGLIAFAKAMEFEVIAEGVEEELQANFLKSLNVEMAQGWFYSRSLVAESFLAFYKEHQN